MVKCWEDSYCVWGNPAVTGRSGRVLRCQRTPPEDHPGAKEEQLLQCNNQRGASDSLLSWTDLSSRFLTHTLENKGSKNTQIQFNIQSFQQRFACELRGVVCRDLHPPTSTAEPESDVTVPVWTFPPFDESWGTANTQACERCVENTPFKTASFVLFLWSPDSLWKSGLVQRRPTVPHHRRLLLARWSPVGWIQSCSRDTRSPIHDNSCY